MRGRNGRERGGGRSHRRVLRDRSARLVCGAASSSTHHSNLVYRVKHLRGCETKSWRRSSLRLCFGASAGEWGFCTSSSYVAYCSYTGSGAPVSERNDRVKTLQAKERV